MAAFEVIPVPALSVIERAVRLRLQLVEGNTPAANMIQLPAPSLALNDARCPGPVFLQRTLKIQKDDSAQNIINAVANFAAAVPGGKLKSLVLNCHGSPGYLAMGKGFDHANVQAFLQWRGLVDTIWITACEVASRKYGKPTVLKTDLGPIELSDGFLFCQRIAMNAGAHVVASQDTQRSPRKAVGKGAVDSFEGAHFCWKPDGSVAWARRFGLTSFE